MKKFLSPTDHRTLKAFLRASLNHKRELIFTSFMLLSTLCINILAPYATSNILASLVTSVNTKLFLIMLVTASIFGVLFNRVGFGALMTLAAKTSKDLERVALTMLLKRGVSFHANNVGGKLVSDTIDYPRSYLQVQNVILIDLIPFVVTTTVGLILIMVNSLVLGLIMTTMTLLIIVWAWRQSVSRADVRATRKEYQRKVTAHIGDSITNVTTVKSFAQEDYELKRHQKLSTRLMNLRIKDWVDVANDGSNRHAALLALQFIFVIYLVQAAANDPSLLGVSIFAFSYSVTMTNRLFQVNVIVRTLEEGLLEAAPMTEYLEEAIEIRDKPDASDLNIVKGLIEFTDVNFRYSDETKNNNIFSNFSLYIKAGERIGLVGPSGGGKSTLIKLLLRFEDLTSGKILIDNQDITDVTQKSLRNKLAYVPQEPLLFHRTITENIAYGTQNASFDDIKEAAKKAQALNFINELSAGFDTVVGERGVKLSGGQRQRIIIARAILKNAPILMLDEATSALDSESEKYIQKALHELMKDKTVIVIAHRLSTINELDRILVVDDGKIVEQGSHKELLAIDGLYAKLWKHQSGGFIED